MKYRFLFFATFFLFVFWSIFSFLPAHGQILNVQRNINLQSKSLYNVDSIGVSTTTIVSSTVILGSGGIMFPDGTTQVTAPGGTVTMSAGNVSSGAFGSNTGGGVFSFPTSVGVGTTTPGALLDVNNGTFGTKLTGMSVNFTRSTGPSYLWAEAVGGYIDLVTNGRPNSDANSNLVLKPDQNSYFNGSVGIGTASPASQSGTFAPIVDLSGPGNGPSLVLHNTGTGKNFEINTFGGAMNFVESGIATRVSIVATSGNVGIATTTPTQKLEVVGNIKVSTVGNGIIFPDGTKQVSAATSGASTVSAGNVSAGAFGSNTGGGNYTFPAKISVGTTTAPVQAVDIFSGGRVRVRDSGVNSGEFFTGASGGLTATHIGSVSNIPIAFFANSSAPLMTITPAGNVGIGSTTPTTAFTVSRNIGNGTQNDIITLDMQTGSFGGFWIKNQGTAGNVYGRIGFTNDVNNSQGIGLVTGAGITPQVFLNSAGNLGVGTMVPFATLSVNKPGSSAYFGGVSPAIYAESLNSGSYGIVGSSPNGGNGAGVLGLGSLGVSGIGTTTVASSIGVSGAATGPGGIGVKATGGLSAGGYAFWGQGDSGVYGLAIGAGKPGVYGEGEKGVIASSTSASGFDLYAAGLGENYFKNNVGIGISNPSSALGVALGGIAVGNNYSQSAIISAGNVAIENGLTVGTTTNSGLVTFSSNTDPHVYIIGPSNYSTLNFVTKGNPATADIGLALGDLSITNNTVGGDINIFAGASASTTISGDYINLSTGGVGGGVRINTLGTKPTCNAQHRGVMWYTWGAGSFPSDAFEVCAPVSGTYAWHTLF